MVEEFCLRSLAGNAVGWVFGLSVFSLKGDHIGWCEDGVLFDIHNDVLGFIPGATGTRLELPALAAEPVVPPMSKRPTVPTLRGRVARPAGKGWSRFCLASYLELSDSPSSRAPYLRLVPGQLRAVGGELAR